MISVSIIIPIFGVEKHIERCLRSVMRQDYMGPIECILVDDCGPDASVKVAQNLITEYHGTNISFKWFYHEKNKGLSGARNTGTKAAVGDYIFYLDSDDEIITHAISSLVFLAEKYPEVDLVYGDWYVSQRYTNLYNNKDLPEYFSSKEVVYHLLRYDVAMTAPNKLIRRIYLVENNLYFLEGVIHEDEYMNCLLANTAQSVAISHVPTYFYFLNPKGITGVYSEKNITSIYSIILKIIEQKFENNSQANIVYCINLFMNSYIHCNNEELIKLGKNVLIALANYSKCTGNMILYSYIHYISLLPFSFFKKVWKIGLFLRVQMLINRMYITLDNY